jgi:nitric oxide dioxygenase
VQHRRPCRAHVGGSSTRADDGEHRQFTVKRVNGGDQPDGDVVLDDAGRPVVFASAGTGGAPMAGTLSHLRPEQPGVSVRR